MASAREKAVLRLSFLGEAVVRSVSATQSIIAIHHGDSAEYGEHQENRECCRDGTSALPAVAKYCGPRAQYLLLARSGAKERDRDRIEAAGKRGGA